MAFGIFQFSLVFTIGYYIGLAPDVAEAVGVNQISLTLSLKNPEDVILTRDQNAILKCEAQSSAQGLSTSWFYEGNPILANDSRVQILSDGSLNISKTAGKNMEGKYQCLAKNDLGAVLSNPATLRIATISRDFIEQPPNINTTEQQPVILPCQIHSIPNAFIYWERDNKILPQNTRYVPLPSGALFITSTHSSDTGSYRCVAKNKILKKPKRSKFGQLIVLPSLTKDSPPKFLPQKLERNLTTLIGDNITLVCPATGWPIPSIKWVYNSDTFISNSTVLHLQNLSSNSTGAYSCIASNPFGRITKGYTIQVYEKPYFKVTPLSISYPSARTVRLDCQAEGIPKPNVKWLKDGVPLEIIGRFKLQDTDLIISHSFIKDIGIYQCIASNLVGQSWVSAQLIPLFSENRPIPPQNVQCQAFDENSICLVWDSTPNTSVQAYSIHLFNAVKVYDFVTNYTYHLASGLAKNLDYTMYVRSYSNDASDQSNNVSCRTGVQGERDLRIKLLSERSVQLSWSRISNDFPCGSTKLSYKVQWKRLGQSSVYIDNTSDLNKNISHLRPSAIYQFRVQSTMNRDDPSPWVTFSLMEKNTEVAVTSAYVNEISSTENQSLTLVTPIQVEVESLSPYSVNLTWTNSDEENLSYSIHCLNVVEKSNHVFESSMNFLQVVNLKPNTLYEFKVRSKNKQDRYSPFSNSIEVQTLTDVPSAVQNLKCRIINATAACVTWKTPIYMNGKLLNYVISYSSNKSLPLEKWSNLYITEKDMFINCWPLEKDEISIILTDLSPELKYNLVVRAATNAGLGNLAVPITFSTFAKKVMPNLKEESSLSESQEDIDYKQKLGVAVGVSISVLCILCCVSCVIFRRRCVKREAVRRARLTVSNNYYPSGVPYSGTSLHLHQDSCATESHEMEQLVIEEGNTHIPPVDLTHLDTKGGIGFPNGQLNGSLKNLQMNGHVTNGHIHITENPRFNYHICNGNVDSKKSKKDSLLPSFKHIPCLQENSVNNKQELQDCHKTESPKKPSSINGLPLNTENSKVSLKLLDVSDYNSNCNSDFVDIYNTNMNNTTTDLDHENGLHDTDIAYLDDSFSALPNRIISPALAPNG